MNKQVNIPGIKPQDGFTSELEKAVDDILNDWSDEEIDRVLRAEDHTFSNQVTPSGMPLASLSSAPAEKGRAYVWGSFAMTTRFYVSTAEGLDVYSVPSPEQAADRRDLALAA